MEGKIYKLYRGEKETRREHYEFTGKTLWDAIGDSGYSSYNPPIIDDWLTEQHEYIEEEWNRKQDFLYNLFCNHGIDWMLDSIEEEFDGKFLEEIEPYFKAYETDECASLMEKKVIISRIDKYKVSIRKDESKEFFKKQRIKRIINRLFEYFEDEFDTWKYERASDDFDCFISDINTDEDKEVAEWFGYEMEEYGYTVDGEDYAMDDLYICPNCGEAQPQSKVKDAYEYYDDPIGLKYRCWECDEEYPYDDYDFREANPHLTDEDIILRVI